LQSSIFHRLSRVLWAFVVTLIVLLAVYVSVGRLLASNLGQYRAEILRELNRSFPFEVDARQVSGEWHSFTPVIVLSGLRLGIPGGGAQVIELGGGRIGLDVLASLRTRSLQVTALELQELSIQGELTADGRLVIRGLTGGDGEIGPFLRNFLLNIERVTLSGTLVQLALPGGVAHTLDLDLRLEREGSRRRLEAQLRAPPGTSILARASGVGDPFRPELFRGNLYLDIQAAEMGALRELWVRGRPDFDAEGDVDLKLWLALDRGTIDVETQVEARDLVLGPPGQAWRLPLERLEMEASLAEARDRWTVFASNVYLQQGGVGVSLPRLQLDAWGESLRARAEDVPLGPLSELLLKLQEPPEVLADALRTLRPRGALTALQLGIADIADPARDWKLEVNFDEVAVDSWMDAPGVSSARGYADLEPGGGELVLDSRQFTMAFPSVYRQPLAYDDIHGSLQLAWDERALVISSGLITAHAVEGTARALFGLTVPLADTVAGPEMELLVGLSDSHPIHRSKYVPYILDQGLRDWLAASIGEGRVRQGGFLWRGSLRDEAEHLRTVQLFFDVADTALQYDPAWPPLSDVDGIVLIDDTDVSVWLERARLLDTEIQRLSAEAWMDEARRMRLVVDARMHGPAADGLAVLNDSPLRDYVDGAFTTWQLTGGLETELQLQLDLGGAAAPPQVAVSTLWRDVSLDTGDIGLSLSAVNGELNYSTAAGFSSRDLAGSLWGRPLHARVTQLAAADRAVSASTPVAVDLAAPVAIADVRRWLDAETLGFARGATPVAARLLIAPDSPGRLTITSTLEGIALDLPPPLDKPAKQARAFDLRMPIAGREGVLRLTLEDEFSLNLRLQDGAVRGGAVAFGETAAEPVPGRLQLGGHLARLDADQWQHFAERYVDAGLFDGGTAGPGAGSPGVDSPGVDAPGAGSSRDDGAARPADQRALEIVVDELVADTLVIRGREVAGVALSARVADGQQWLAATTDWLRAEYRHTAGGAPPRLDIGYLDLSGLASLDIGVDADQSALQFPDMQVNITQLRRGERPLGSLSFDLQSRDTLLSAGAIRGELAGMRLRAEDAGHVHWQQGEEAGTGLALTLHFDDLGRTLQEFGYEKTLETEKGTLRLQLDWPGAPQAFAMARSSGSLQVALGRGRFLEASPGTTGALRVVSILNLADIVQRLDLTQMFESGIPFHTVDGEILLQGGTIEVPRMEVKGSSSSFQFSGVSEVATRNLRGELVATLPVASNLPWVAALAAGLPVAAGVFVVSKVFEKQVNSLSSAIYTIGGTWDDPKVKFQRIFDPGPRSPAPAARAPGDEKTEAGSPGVTEPGAATGDQSAPP